MATVASGAEIERNIDLLFFKKQLRLVVRSNRSRTNVWRKDGSDREHKDKRNYKYTDGRLKHHRYKWDQPYTVIELPTIPEVHLQQAGPGSIVPGSRLTKSQPSSRQDGRFPRLTFTSGRKPQTSVAAAARSDRYTYGAWEQINDHQIVLSRDQYTVPTPAPDLSLSLFREFVCAYNPTPQIQRQRLLVGHARRSGVLR